MAPRASSWWLVGKRRKGKIADIPVGLLRPCYRTAGPGTLKGLRGIPGPKAPSVVLEPLLSPTLRADGETYHDSGTNLPRFSRIAEIFLLSSSNCLANSACSSFFRSLSWNL